MIRKLPLLLKLLIVLSVFGSRAVQASDTIKIGVLACLSGGCAEWGVATKNGLLIAQDEINSKGGVLGRRIELVFEDTDEATSATKAVTALKKLLSHGDIKLFIGPTWTPAALAIVPVAGSMHDVLMISPSVGVAEFNESSPNLFNTMMHSESATKKLAQLARSTGWKRAGVFSSEQPWESLQAKVFKEEFTRLGGEVVAFVEPNPDAKDLRTEALKVSASKPDGVFLANLNQSAIAARQLRTLKYSGQFFCALLDQTRVDEADGALEGAISAQSPEANASFTTAYNQRFGGASDAAADTAHDALVALAKAITAAGVTDSKFVQKALLDVTFDGASGRIAFDTLGGVIREPRLVMVTGKKIVSYSGK